jgi:ankyrin repeat protein
VAAEPADLFKQAVFEADVEALKRLLESAEVRELIDQPLFHFDGPAVVQAAGSGKREILDALLDAGANIDQRSTWWAGGFGVLDVAEPGLSAYLIRRGATIDAHAAARLGMIEKLRELLDRQPALVHARGGDGKTPLHFASTVEIAEFLLAQGAEIDALDVDHESTAVQYLVQSNPDVARYLVSRGAKTDLLLAAGIGDTALAARHLDADSGAIRMRVNEHYFPKQNPRAGGTIYIWTLGANKTAHYVARKFGHVETLKLLMERSPDDVKLVNLFALGDRKGVTELLTRRPELVGQLSADDQHQICFAAQDNDVDTVRLMLEHGWPVDGGAGTTPLHWAGFHGNLEMVREILKHAPPIDKVEPMHQATPLGWAIHGSLHGWYWKSGDYPGVVEALLRAGAKKESGVGGTPAVQEVLRRFA